MRAWKSFLVLLFPFGIFAQISYLSLDDLLVDESKSLFPIGFADLNGDYRDDIIQLDAGTDFNLYIQNGSLNKPDIFTINDAIPSQGWTISIADLNKNGMQEIMVSGNGNQTSIYSFSNGNYQLSQTIPTTIFSQGSNFVDINNDSWIDLFICNDIGDNRIYLNDQTGFLVQEVVTNWNTVPPSDNSGNYGSEWVDIDDDGDMDLYVAKCRLGVTDTTDPRRINILMENDGAGNLSEKAADYNLDIPWQSWTGSFGDVDNDGDLDCYVVNHDYAHQLLKNNNGIFLSEEEFIGFPFIDNSIQSILRDLDNDTDLDVLITGPKDYVLWNNGDGSFVLEEEPFGPIDWYSAAVGDYNNDGFYDVLLSEANSSSVTGDIPDRLLLATANENNYLKISLSGCQSNPDGIGSRVLAYGEWGVQRRDVRAGESYSIVNSRNMIFGLAQYSAVDSVVVYWPSGLKDIYINPEINSHHIINEGSCALPTLDVIVEGSLDFCPGDTLRLTVDTTLPFTWNNGSSDNPLVVTEGGSYYAFANEGACCKTLSELIYVDADPDILLPKINTDKPAIICDGYDITLSVGLYDNILWSTGEETTSVQVDSPGIYSVQVKNLGCGNSWSDSIFIDQFIPDVPTVDGDSIDEPGVVNLSAIGDSIHWYETSESDVVIHTGATYNPSLQVSTDFWVSNVAQQDVGPIFVGETTHTGDSFYSGDNLNSGLIFDALAPFTLNAVSVFSDIAGTREIELRSNDGTVLQSKVVMVPADQWTRVLLNFEIPQEEDLRLTTNGNHNLQNIGIVSPRLIRSFDVPLFYPFVIEDIVSINGTPQSADYYYYFYNWEIGQGVVICESPRVKVQGIVDEESGTTSLVTEGIRIFPNPVNDVLHISFDQGKVLESFSIYNNLGQKLHSGSLQMNNNIDLDLLNAGHYTLRLYSSKLKASYNYTFVKLK